MKVPVRGATSNQLGFRGLVSCLCLFAGMPWEPVDRLALLQWRGLKASPAHIPRVGVGPSGLASVMAGRADYLPFPVENQKVD